MSEPCNLRERYGYSIFDSLIIAAALHSGTCHDRSPLSSPAWRRTWIGMARWSFVNAFVRRQDVTPFSGFAATATGGSVTAVTAAALKPAGVSAAAPTAGISEDPRESSIIATASAATAIAAPA